MNMDTITRSVEAPVTEVNKKTGVVRAIVSDDSNDRSHGLLIPRVLMGRLGNERRWCATTTGKASRGLFPVGNAVEMERTTYRAADSSPYGDQVLGR